MEKSDRWFLWMLILILIPLAFVEFMKQQGAANTLALMPEQRPRDFNFVLDYGIMGKNQIDTINGTYTRDMVLNPSVTINLKLEDEEMDIIYRAMRDMRILDYPSNFHEITNTMQTPYSSYSLKLQFNGTTKEIKWEDENASNSTKAVRLRKLFSDIHEMISKRDAYKKLPQPKGGYD